ncbi:diguanylate cyclase [Arcobacter peruensis]|uniref:diguanylate cyclase n=1 Tax=Arcobacter peruensis TaxID=2320140 RepID=UPI000F075EE7|nr:diguanylate cyclase [Arcobacter peruensis]
MKKLLIIDDSIHVITTFMKLFSEKNNFSIYTASNTKEAKKLIDNETFFTVISSTKYLDKSDNKSTNILKSDYIPIIILSSKINNELLEKYKDFNVMDYVLKDTTYGLKHAYNLVELFAHIKDYKVLLISESIDSKVKIKHVLKSFSLDIKQANCNSEIIDIVKNDYDISFIIFDYETLLEDIISITKMLRENEKYSNVPILIINNEINKDLKTNLYKIGVDDFIQKPIIEEELKTKIFNLFTNIEQREELDTFNKIFDDNIISSSTNTKGIITSVSSAFSKISGYKKSELVGKSHSIVRHPDMPSSVYKDLWGTINLNNTWKGEIKNLRKDGSSYWVSAVIEPIFDKQKNKIGYSAVRQDITDKKRIYELSITDGLTSLYNRRYFNDIAKAIFDKTVRSNKVFGFMILDIDYFKKYNDTYGHQEGDNVLIALSMSLKDTFKRSDDLIFRLGGEEFGVLINAKIQEDILELANLAKSNIEELEIKHKENPPLGIVTASFGLIIIEGKDIDSDHKLDFIYKEADNKLYEAKADGRNNIKYKII